MLKDLEDKVKEILECRSEDQYFIIQPDCEQNKRNTGFLCDLSADTFSCFDKVPDFKKLKKGTMISSGPMDDKIKSLKPREIDSISWDLYPEKPIWCGFLLHFRETRGQNWIFDIMFDNKKEFSGDLEKTLRICLKKQKPNSDFLQGYKPKCLISEECERSLIFRERNGAVVRIRSSFVAELIQCGILRVES